MLQIIPTPADHAVGHSGKTRGKKDAEPVLRLVPVELCNDVFALQRLHAANTSDRRELNINFLYDKLCPLAGRHDSRYKREK